MNEMINDSMVDVYPTNEKQTKEAETRVKGSDIISLQERLSGYR